MQNKTRSYKTSTLLQLLDTVGAVLSEQISSGTHISWEKRLTNIIWLTQISCKEGIHSPQKVHHKLTEEHLSAQEVKLRCGSCTCKAYTS